VCAFTRGDEGEVLVIVVLRDAGRDAVIDVPAGRYADVLSGREVAPEGATTAGSLVGPEGLALLSRTS